MSSRLLVIVAMGVSSLTILPDRARASMSFKGLAWVGRCVANLTGSGPRLDGQPLVGGQDQARVDALWARLRANGRLVSQAHASADVGACALVSAVNASQAALAVHALPPIDVPRDVLMEMFGRVAFDSVSPTMLIRELRRILAQHAPGRMVMITMVNLPGTDPEAPPETDARAPTAADLVPHPGEVKLIAGFEWKAGKIVSHHVKIIKSATAAKIVTVDPSNAGVDLEIKRKGSGRIGPFEVPYYRYEGSIKLQGIDGFTPATVITIRLGDAQAT